MPKTLAEIAIEAGLVVKADATRAGRIAEQRHEPLIAVLVRELGVDEVALLAAVCRQTRTPLVDPASARPDPEALRELPRDLCRRLRCLPLSIDLDRAGVRVMRLAMADPTDAAAIAEVEHTWGGDLDVAVLPLSAVEELIEDGYRAFTTAVTQRPRRRFGDDLVVSTRPHSRPGEETAEVPATVPFHVITDEADVGLRHRALLGLLVGKGLITDEEYQDAVRDLLRRRDEEP